MAVAPGAVSKSYALLLEALRHTGTPGFTAVIFRRTTKLLINPGGLWDSSYELYPLSLGTPRQNPNYEWVFGKQMPQSTIRFAHMEHEKNRFDWQGSQICMIGFDELTEFCLTPDHDVLTERGWIPIADVRTTDRVLSRIGDRAEFRDVLDTPAFDHDGDMICVEQRNGISLCATPNHRVLIKRQDENESLGFVRADHLEQTVQTIPRQGSIDQDEMTEPVRFERPTGQGFGPNANSVDRCGRDTWIEFLGWFLSEGSAWEKTVAISQTKPAPKLDSLMRRVPWRAIRTPGEGWRVHSRQLSEALRPFGNTYEKRIPRWLTRCSRRQMRVFLDAFAEGDGHRQSTGAISIGLANRGLRDDLQEIATLCGLVSTANDTTDSTGRHDVYTLNISRESRSDTQVKPKSVSRKPYRGTVHCLVVDCPPIADFTRGGYKRPPVPGGNFLVRRNGRVHFTGNSEAQFWYMQSRNRSTCGVQPYMRATTNPDADSWVARLIDWYIDEEGYAIPERSGVIRWIERDGDVVRWFDERNSEDSLSFTFIRSKLEDNVKLLEVDPRYRARLTSGLTIVDRERLLHGNWKIRPAAGLYFNREWVELVDPRDVPERMRMARGWDLAGTEDRPGTDPDWTCGTKMGLADDDGLWILDHVYDRLNPGGVKDLVRRTAKEDTQDVEIAIPQDPGQAGKSQVQDYIQTLRGYTVRTRTMSGDKVVRFSPFSARCLNGFKHGNRVKVVRGSWNDRWFRELENFPPKQEGGRLRGHDDDADAASECFHLLNNQGGSILTGRWYTG